LKTEAKGDRKGTGKKGMTCPEKARSGATRPNAQSSYLFDAGNTSHRKKSERGKKMVRTARLTTMLERMKSNQGGNCGNRESEGGETNREFPQRGPFIRKGRFQVPALPEIDKTQRMLRGPKKKRINRSTGDRNVE